MRASVSRLGAVRNRFNRVLETSDMEESIYSGQKRCTTGRAGLNPPHLARKRLETPCRGLNGITRSGTDTFPIRE
jgi:hypothetical protein